MLTEGTFRTTTLMFQKQQQDGDSGHAHHQYAEHIFRRIHDAFVISVTVVVDEFEHGSRPSTVVVNEIPFCSPPFLDIFLDGLERFGIAFVVLRLVIKVPKFVVALFEYTGRLVVESDVGGRSRYSWMRHAVLAHRCFPDFPHAARVSQFQPVGFTVVVAVCTAQVQRPLVVGGFEGCSKDIQCATTVGMEVAQGTVRSSPLDSVGRVGGVDGTEAVGNFVTKGREGEGGGGVVEVEEEEEKKMHVCERSQRLQLRIGVFRV